MTNHLHTQLVSTLTSAGVDPALSEAEIDSYPYVTFELPVEYRYNKDGVYKLVGNLTIRSVSDDFDEADSLRASIESAIASGFDGSPVNIMSEPEDPEETPTVLEVVYYTARLTDVRKDCTDGVWVIELDYILNQSE
jgi:hypothetical protein